MAERQPMIESVKNALAVAVYERNTEAWRSPDRGNGSPTLLSNVSNLQKMIGDGGTLWVLLSRKRLGEANLYSLAYKLVECERFKPRGPSAEKFGKYGVRGNPASSSFFPTNDAQLVLMSLRFASGAPIPRLSKIGQHLRFPRYLNQDDVLLLEQYVECHIDRRSVFVSYAHEDSGFAAELKDALERHGISVFRDEESILSGENWREGISRAIEHAMYFVVLCSPAAARSKEVYKEMEQARKRRSSAGRRNCIIVPILLEGASLEENPWSELAEFQALRWNQACSDTLLEKLAADFKHERIEAQTLHKGD